MKFCPKLFNDINFEPHALTSCCNTWNLTIPSFPYEGGEIDLKEYANHIENTLSRLQKSDKVCSNCPDLVEIDNLPYMSGQFKTISINMHRYLCNCKCIYCNLWNHPDKGIGYDVLPGLASLESQGAIANNAHISWGGGESSILPGFEAASKWILDKGYFQMIHSNAIRFSPSIKEILSNNRGRLNISLDSGTPAGYKTVKGVDAFAKVYSTLKKYAAANPANIELKYIIFDKNNNMKEIDSFLSLAESMNIKNIDLSFNFLEINNNTISETTLDAAVYLVLKAALLDFKLSTFFIPPKWRARLEAKIAEAQS